MTKLTLDDIADLRAYERERDEFRQHVIALKKRRRVPVGPHVTLLFENRDTIRFQIQEMARAEKLMSDEQIKVELDVYNPLIPEPGRLSATMFIELTSEADLRAWLPKLVGIERAVEIRVGGATPVVLASEPEAAHARALTREEITPSVHYIQWQVTPEQIEAFREGPVEVAVTHPEYQHATTLNDDTRAELLADLTATG